MTWDIITTLGLIFSIFSIWIQRKTILELERDVWEIETAYKNETGKVYHYKHRTFELWGKNGGKQKEEQN
jgi:hypothetical protein